MKVEKRDGRIQQFDFGKIAIAVSKVFASKSVQKNVPDRLLDKLKDYFEKISDKKPDDYVIPIEDIQDIIRNFLINVVFPAPRNPVIKSIFIILSFILLIIIIYSNMSGSIN